MSSTDLARAPGAQPAPLAPPSAARRAALEGARDTLPVALGLLPFAVAIGALIRTSDVDPVAGWAGSFLLCAGAAQVAAVELLDGGAAPLLAVGAVALVNARFALYSTAFARWFADEPLRRRLLLVFPLVDQLFVLCAERFTRTVDRAERRAYYGGAALVLVSLWAGGQAAGLRFSSSLPSGAQLELAAPLSLTGLLVGRRPDTGMRVAMAAGGVAAVAAASVAPHLGLLAGAVAGLAAGAVADRRWSS